MRIHYAGMLSTNHSWAIVGREICLALDRLGHHVSIASSNGLQNVNEDIMRLSRNARYKDLSLSYSLPANLPRRLTGKCKLAIYNYETTILPPGWARLINIHCDKILPSSEFSAKIMRDNGVKANKIKVVPHGIDPNAFHPDIEPLHLPTNKAFKFLFVGTNHKRKGLDILLKAFVRAFSGKDDVSLIVKVNVHNPKIQKSFHCDPHELLTKVRRFKVDMPEILLLTQDIDHMAQIYNACNVFVLPTRSEGFGMPFLEAAACGLPTIATNYGGQVDFLNSDNAYLLDYRIKVASPEMQYWITDVNNAIISEPNEEHLVQLLQQSYKEYRVKRKIVMQYRDELVNLYNWERSAIDIINVAKECNESI